MRAKEEELRKREAALHKTTASHIKNWPICYPVAKHYPSTEIPANHKWTVRLAYWTYLSALRVAVGEGAVMKWWSLAPHPLLMFLCVAARQCPW